MIAYVSEALAYEPAISREINQNTNSSWSCWITEGSAMVYQDLEMSARAVFEYLVEMWGREIMAEIPIVKGMYWRCSKESACYKL